MNLKNLIRSSLIAAGMLSISAYAFARQPPALRRAQESASCAGEHARSGAGYRDAFTRFGGRSTRAQGSTAVRLGAGYRETRARFSQTAPVKGVACREPARPPLRSAMRR
jgi:hypothetical protein